MCYIWVACNKLFYNFSYSPIFTRIFYKTPSDKVIVWKSHRINQILLGPLDFINTMKLAFQLEYGIPIEADELELSLIK